MVWGAPRGIDDILARVRANDASLTSLYLMRQRRFEEADARALCDALAKNTILKDLNISSHAISPLVAAMFASLLSATASLNSLDLGNSTFGDAGLAALCPGIAASPSILRLILDGKGLTAESCIPLAEALSQNSSLRELDLSRNDITCTGLASLANALGTLRRLSLAACALSGAEAGSVLSQILSTTNIEILRLEENPIDAAFITTAAPGLKVAPSLIELHLGNCPIGSDGITTLFNNLPLTLKFLDVSGCSAGPAGLDAAGQALAAGAAPGLRRLMICSAGGDDASLAACINGASHLLQLDLSGNVVGPQAIKALAACSGLHSVCLHNCKMGSEGCQALCTEVEAQSGQAFQTLKELDLSGNGLETADLVALLRLLRSTSAACPALEQLVLAANPGAMEEAVIEATQALQSVRHGLDVVRRSADTGERDGKQHQQQFPTLD